MGTDDSQGASNDCLHPTRTNREDGLSALERQLSRLLQLLRMISQADQLTHTYSRPCTPPKPLIGSAQPACVAALEQQPTIASSRRHP